MKLTERELQILRLIAHGTTATMRIAAELGISYNTVKSYRTRILFKLDATDIAHAVGIAYQTRILTVGAEHPSNGGAASHSPDQP